MSVYVCKNKLLKRLKEEYKYTEYIKIKNVIDTVDTVRNITYRKSNKTVHEPTDPLLK